MKKEDIMRKIIVIFIMVLAVFSISNNSFSATYDATGQWTITTSNYWVDQGNSGDCEAGSDGPKNVSIDQNGDSFIITIDGKDYEGSISGATYTGSITYDEDGGITDESIDVTLTSETSGSGTGEWYWSDGYYSCSGGYDISMTRSGAVDPIDVDDGGGGSDDGGIGGCFVDTIIKWME